MQVFWTIELTPEQMSHADQAFGDKLLWDREREIKVLPLGRLFAVGFRKVAG